MVQPGAMWGEHLGAVALVGVETDEQPRPGAHHADRAPARVLLLHPLDHAEDFAVPALAALGVGDGQSDVVDPTEPSGRLGGGCRLIRCGAQVAGGHGPTLACPMATDDGHSTYLTTYNHARDGSTNATAAARHTWRVGPGSLCPSWPAAVRRASRRFGGTCAGALRSTGWAVPRPPGRARPVRAP